MKHTPGPWRYDDTWSLIMGPDNREICAIHSARLPGELRQRRKTAEDNARLIAAAPELLEALQSLIERVEETFDVTSARKAIAKATGTEDK